MQQNTLLLVPDMTMREVDVKVEEDGLFKVLERIRWSKFVRRENMQLQVGNNDKDITENNDNDIFFIFCCEREKERREEKEM